MKFVCRVHEIRLTLPYCTIRLGYYFREALESDKYTRLCPWVRLYLKGSKLLVVTEE